MELLSTYYWQKTAANRTSLLLQQGVLSKRGENVLFGCVATGCPGGDVRSASGERLPLTAAGYLTRQLQEWYRREALPILARSGAGGFGALQDKLAGVIGRTDAELAFCAEKTGTGFGSGDSRDAEPEKTALSGCLFAEDQCLLFHRGGQRIYLLNNRFARANIKRLTPRAEDGALHFFLGTAQPGVGLLLATEPFYEFLTEEMLNGCLAQREIGTEERAEKRLSELGKEAVCRGADSPGALYVLAVQTGGAV